MVINAIFGRCGRTSTPESGPRFRSPCVVDDLPGAIFVVGHEVGVDGLDQAGRFVPDPLRDHHLGLPLLINRLT
jgi:hypothetical protein